MNSVKVLYFHTLDLTFKSAQTIQVVKDYYYLSKHGVEVSIYGTYANQKDYLVIKKYLSNSDVNIFAKPNNFMNKALLKISFFLDFLKKNRKKVIVTRHYKKLSLVLKLKKIGLKFFVLHEMHEEAFPYLFKKKVSKKYIQSLFLDSNLDLIIYTNFSQQDFFKKEFANHPRLSIVLPNGVEIERFRDVTMSPNFTITYGGGFNEWKNLDLVFESLSLLDKKYKLRVAGGKGDKKSEIYINQLIEKYKIESDRVSYLGFVDNKQFPNKVLNNSNVLVLPLGENIQSRYLTSPMKLFEYMATKTPVLAVNFPSVTKIAKDTIFLSQMNAVDFARNITQICELNEKKLDTHSMNELVQGYSYENRSKQFFKEIINVIS